MGCFGSKTTKMNNDIAVEALSTFRKIDTDRKGKLTAEIVEKYWRGAYSKVYTQVLFREVDLNADGAISQLEWLAYWEIVLRAGYSKAEITDSLKTIREGTLKLDFDRVRQYKNGMHRQTLVNEIAPELQHFIR